MTTTEDSAVGTDDFIGHNVSGKHLLLRVPDYEDSGTGLLQATKHTYLNLGRGWGDQDSAEPSWDAQIEGEPNWTAEGLNEAALPAATNSGDDLLAQFGGFTDDTRLRGKGGSFGLPIATPPNETAERTEALSPYGAVGASAATTGTGRNLEVTRRIPDYVGWRDHTDGHRISTTRGDKIEIIGGNYKIVSLGRGQGVAEFQMSGGIILDGDDAPGSVSSVSWRPCPSGDTGESGWKVVEQVSKGNVVERYHGTKREEFFGDKLISVTGSPDEAATGLEIGEANNGQAETYVGDTALATLQNQTKKNVATKGTLDSFAYPTKWDTDGAPPPKLAKPQIYESTWAQSITEYTNVGTVTSHTHVTGAITETSHIEGDHKVNDEYGAGFDGVTTLRAFGKKYIETWKMSGSMGFFEFFEGAMTQFFLGASTTMGLANRFEVFVGIEEQLNFGGFFELKMGGQLGVSVGPKTELETSSLKFWLAKEDTALKELETSLSTTQALLSETRGVLSTKGCGLSSSARFLMTDL